jgi:hypothetical protein
LATIITIVTISSWYMNEFITDKIVYLLKIGT